jgi:hypothetical protein
MTEDTASAENAIRIDPLQRSIDALNLAEVESWINATGAPELGGIVERFKRSRVLVQQWTPVERLRKRDEFFTKLLKLLEGKAEPDVIAEINRLVNGARLFERAYAEIRDALSQIEISQLPQDEQIWAWIRMIHSVSLTIKNDLERHLRDTKLAVDPDALQIQDQEGVPFNPDAAWNLIIESVSGSLLMLGHRSKLFDKDGVLIVPPMTPFNGAHTRMAEKASLLAASWNVVERAEQRWRWWEEGDLRIEQKTIEDNGVTRSVDHLVYEHDFFQIEVWNTVANERLIRFINKARQDVDEQIGEVAAALVGEKNIPLMPAASLNREESVSAYSLSALLKFDVLKDSREYAGLTFPEWLRGYAQIQKVATDAQVAGQDINGVYSLPQEMLVEGLGRVGLSVSKAHLLLKYLSFNRDADDLFDAPLLRSSDGLVHLIVPIILGYNVPLLILSQLSRLNENIGRKGSGLEDYVQRRLTGLGMPCKGLKFKEGEEEYEYDAVFVLDDVLFIFECKNRSIPGGSPRRLYEFIRDVGAHVEQLSRLVDAASRYPERVRERLGSNVTWSRIVGSVLYGLPWSIGSVGNYFVNDCSALVRFFEVGWMLMPAPKDCDPKIEEIWKKTLGGLWSSQKPSAVDLEKQLADPWQVRFLAKEFAAISPTVPLSKNMIFSRPRLIRIPPSLRRMLESFGLVGEELELLATAYLPEHAPEPA